MNGFESGTARPVLPADAVLLDTGSRSGGRQYVARAVVDGRTVVVKGYGRTRSWVRTLLREFGHQYLSGKSSQLPSARCATEWDCLQTWRRLGFDVPEPLAIDAPTGFTPPCLVMEWVEGKSLGDLLEGAEHGLLVALRRVAHDMARRHEAALALGEHRLIQVHSTVRHVLLSGPRIVWIDFEAVYRRRHPIERLISLEIAAFLRSLRRAARTGSDECFEAFLAAYPRRRQFQRMRADLLRSTCAPIAPFSWLALHRERRQPEKRGGVLADVERLASRGESEG